MFEGSEKKVEVVVDTSRVGALNEMGRDFWDGLVESAGARILSEVSNDKCTAYLLSESSLFVWDDSFLLITCGNARLVEGILFFIVRFGPDSIRSLIFQRKNEYHSHLQHSTFEDDAKVLSNALKGGTSLRFGKLDEHHAYMFYMESGFRPGSEDRTTEFLMYHMGDEAVRFFMRPDLQADEIQSFLGIGSYLKGFVLDDYIFKPYGYSFNAIGGDRYMTMHITPQDDISYVSFETNVKLEGGFATMVGKMAEVFRPFSFDLIDFNAHSEPAGGFTRINRFSERLGQGYRVNFSHFIATHRSRAKPVVLQI